MAPVKKPAAIFFKAEKFRPIYLKKGYTYTRVRGRTIIEKKGHTIISKIGIKIISARGSRLERTSLGRP